MKLNTSRETVTLVRRRHKILIIGDSHFRGLPEKISNCLNNSFSVVGITKPNAGIEAITSPLHFITDNLTKKKRQLYSDTSANEDNSFRNHSR